MAPCPGTSTRRPDALRHDIQVIQKHRPTALVSLVTAAELSPRTLSAIREVSEQAGLEWHWLPIPAMRAPQAEFEAQWLVTGSLLRRRLRAGERIVLHCWGGLGRCGTIAARLLVELGVPAEAAIHDVRRVNSRAIETRVQEAHIAACSIVPF